MWIVTMSTNEMGFVSMSDHRWLDDREQRAWRSLVAMQADLRQCMERQL